MEFAFVSEPLLLSRELFCSEAPYSFRKRGRRVGRQAQMIPTDCSTEYHVAESTVVYVGSATCEVLNWTMRRMETTHTPVVLLAVFYSYKRG